MAFTHRITRAWQDAANRALTGTITSSTDSEVNLDIAFPINADTTVDALLLFAGLKSLYLKSDKNITVTFKSAAPATVGTLALVANIPYDWTSQDDQTQNPLVISADAVTLHVNAAAVGTLNVRALQDSTP